MLIRIIDEAQSVFILGCFQGSCFLYAGQLGQKPEFAEGDGLNKMVEVRLAVLPGKLIAN